MSVARRHRQHGVSLIEALVTLFILSIGMLGVAGLQSAGLKAGHSATLRSLAVFHSQEIVERMRANRDALVSYANPGQNMGCVDVGVVAKVCSAAELAQDDVYHWQQSVQAAFPAGLVPEANVVVNAAAVPVAVTVTILWTERKGTQTEGTKSYVSNTLL